MKKVITMFLAIVLVCILGVPSFAYRDEPTCSEYEVICPKKVDYFNIDSGTDTIKKAGSFPVGTELTVWYENNIDGVAYAAVETEDSEKYPFIYVKLSDVRLKNESYPSENGTRLENPYRVVVIASGGIEMRKGPSKIYSAVTTIPKNAEIDIQIGNAPYIGADASWAYVTYRQYSGWIYIYESDIENGVAEIPLEESKAKIWALKDNINMYNGISNANLKTAMSAEFVAELEKEYKEDNERLKVIFEGSSDKIVGTLQKGKQYAYQYSHLCDYGVWYYVTAGLRSGWVFMAYDEISNIAVDTDADHHNFRKAFRSFTLKLYDFPDQDATFSTVTVPKDTVFNPLYFAQGEVTCFFYETIGGKSGWWAEDEAVSDNTVYAVQAFSERDNLTNYMGQDGGTPIYSDAIKRDKQIGTIPAKAQPEILYSGSYEIPHNIDEPDEQVQIVYVRYQGLSGWVLRDDLFCPREDAEEPTAEETTEYIDETDWDLDEEYMQEYFDNDEPTPEEEASDEDGLAKNMYGRRLTSVQIVLLCVGTVAALALTVTLVVRKKRRVKRAAEPHEKETNTQEQ